MMEEFILRIGTDARAMVSGLQRAGAYAKAWGMTLVEDLKSQFGRILGAGFVFAKIEEFGRRTLENIREKILAIHRAQDELPGASSNFIQGLMNQAERLGLSFDEISKPLLAFKKTLDAAKLNPAGKEAENLLRYNIVADLADLKTQKFSTSVARLSDEYLKLGKNLQVIADVAGKGGSKNPALLAIMGLGGDKIQGMDRFNFFSDIGSSSINLSAGLFGAQKGMGQVITATTANLMERLSTTVLSSVFAGNSPMLKMGLDLVKKYVEKRGEAENRAADETAQLRESLSMEQQRVDANVKLLELTEKRHSLEAEIADQGKVSMAGMAAEARRLTGAQAPRLYTVTSRMRTALNIDNLEKRSQIAFERGDDALHDKLWNQAQSLRSSNSFLRDQDQNPMRRTEMELKVVNEQLKPVAAMAAFVSKEHAQ